MSRTILTPAQAEAILPDGDLIHTFYNLAAMLVGADWLRDQVLDKLNETGVMIELTGEQARKTGHGMCVHPNADHYYQSDILFIETDEEKVKRFEEALKDAEDT